MQSHYWWKTSLGKIFILHSRQFECCEPFHPQVWIYMTIEMQCESTMQLFLVEQTANRQDVLLSKLQDCYSGNDAHQMHIIGLICY